MLTTFFLHADTMISGAGSRYTKTVRTNDKRYITQDSVTIPTPLESAILLIESTDTWNTWMFSGMDGSEKVDHFLLIYIIDMEILERSSLKVMIDFRFLRNLGKKAECIPFSIAWNYSSDGLLENCTVTLDKPNAMLESARYTITISGSDNQSMIDYNAEVKLKGFFDFMVSLRSYRKTIEWYLDRIITNYTNELLP